MIKIKAKHLRDYRYDWREHINISKFDIKYNLNEFNKQFISVNNMYYFKIFLTSLDFYKEEIKLFSVYLPNNISWQKPLQFIGVFRFYTYSNHLFWKWDGLKLRLLLYYDYGSRGIVLRFLYKNLNQQDIKIKIFSDSLRFVTSKKRKDSYIYENNTLIFDKEMKENRIIFFDMEENLNFSKEEQKWVSHCKQVKRVYKRKLLLVEDEKIMKEFLLNLYRESNYGTIFDKFIPFEFLNFDYKNYLQIFNDFKVKNKFFFRFFFNNYFIVEGCYSDNKLINCMIINKGINELKIKFGYKRFLNKKYFFVFNNRLKKLMDVNFITNGFIVSFEKSDKIFINFFKNILKKIFS